MLGTLVGAMTACWKVDCIQDLLLQLRACMSYGEYRRLYRGIGVIMEDARSLDYGSQAEQSSFDSRCVMQGIFQACGCSPIAPSCTTQAPDRPQRLAERGVSFGVIETAFDAGYKKCSMAGPCSW